MVKKCTALVLSMCLALSLFSTNSYAFSLSPGSILDGLTNQLWNANDSQNKYVHFVKDATNSRYPDVTYGEAFDEFFAYPTWKYFQGSVENTDSDNSDGSNNTKEIYDIVEFTGYCSYRDTEVKARLQFQLDLEEGTFFARSLSFNDVPQVNLVMGLLLERVFESSAEEQAPDTDSASDSIDYAFNSDDDEFYYSKDPISLDELSGEYSGEFGECSISMYTSLEPDGSVGEAQITVDETEYEGTIYTYGTNLYGVVTDDGGVLYLGADVGAHGICVCVQLNGYTVGQYTMIEHYES